MRQTQRARRKGPDSSGSGNPSESCRFQPDPWLLASNDVALKTNSALQEHKSGQVGILSQSTVNTIARLHNIVHFPKHIACPSQMNLHRDTIACFMPIRIRHSAISSSIDYWLDVDTWTTQNTYHMWSHLSSTTVYRTPRRQIVFWAQTRFVVGVHSVMRNDALASWQPHGYLPAQSLHFVHRYQRCLCMSLSGFLCFAQAILKINIRNGGSS